MSKLAQQLKLMAVVEEREYDHIWWYTRWPYHATMHATWHTTCHVLMNQSKNFIVGPLFLKPTWLCLANQVINHIHVGPSIHMGLFIYLFIFTSIDPTLLDSLSQNQPSNPSQPSISGPRSSIPSAVVVPPMSPSDWTLISMVFLLWPATISCKQSEPK